MKRILIFYSHFTPAFKAGGPIQSINNMVELIKDNFIIDVVCSAYDLGDKQVLKNIVPDQWNTLKNINVFYIKTGAIKKIIAAFNEGNPDMVYINGVFLPLYSWLPLLLAKRKNIPVVFTPRGMLQKGAMANGLKKKLLSIWLLKVFHLFDGITWHATDEQEKEDILGCFDKNALVQVIGNVPKPPLVSIKKTVKEKGSLRLVYLSLISQKKNLAFVLTILKKIYTPIVFDIYGPVKDKTYWNECLSLMPGQIHTISYCGPVNPIDVQATLKKYHAFILLTKGENFGHAIYEALSSGTPAIISQYTPWGNLQSCHAGITVNNQNEDVCQAALENFIVMDQEEFDVMSEGASKLARQYYSGSKFKEMYISLFTLPDERF